MISSQTALVHRAIRGLKRKELLSQAGAMCLARQLERYWHDKGYRAARCWAEALQLSVKHSSPRRSRAGAFSVERGARGLRAARLQCDSQLWPRIAQHRRLALLIASRRSVTRHFGQGGKHAKLTGVTLGEANLNLDDLLARMQLVAESGVELRAMITAQQKLVKEIETYDPLRLAATFAGLLTVPQLQSNCIRLESLVHVALASARGKRKPNAKILSRLFAGFGNGIAGWKEDPAEDVFVAEVTTKHGNFRILEGVWEAAGFHLQRIVNTLEALPPVPLCDRMRACMYALLRISDLVCERAGLLRNQLGNSSPLETLPGHLCAGGSALRRIVRFSDADLAAAKIAVEHLAEFVFDPGTRRGLLEENVGHSSLERFPIAHRNGEYFLLLPTAVSAALRRYVMENVRPNDMRKAFIGVLAREYARLFSDTPLLGSMRGGNIEFRETVNGIFAGVTTKMDHGLYMNVVFFVDTLEGFETTGFLGTNQADQGFSDHMERWIDAAYDEARKQQDFRAGVSLVVGCGVGRSLIAKFREKHRPNWRTEFISASDLVTLSWVPDFKPLSLWRLLEAQDRVEALGVQLQNINGLLNLVAWARSLGGHVVPHGDLPEEFGSGDVPTLLVVEQNALRGLRHEVAAHWDPHAVQDADGRWARVRKDGQSLFEEDEKQPFFVTEERANTRWPLCVYEAPKRAWWSRLETTEVTNGKMAFERSKMLKTWLCRAAPILDAALPDLPPGPVVWCCRFQGDLIEGRPHESREFSKFEDALSSITVSIDKVQQSVILTISARFEDAHFHPENIAERALVTRTVEGFIELAGRPVSADERDVLVAKIVPDASARQTHLFVAQKFRDYVRGSVPSRPITINGDDSALIKLGLGWRVRDRALGGDIRDKEECTAFLNSVVDLLADEVCEELRSLDRRAVVEFALKNYESAALDRDNWERTAAALLSLHDDKEATLETMARRVNELNQVFQASRLLIEFAICESPLSGGRTPGRLDISRLMAKLMLIVGMGGWSDAIHWEAMEARLRVTALGDIHANVSFAEEVLAPYGRVGSDLRFEDSAKNYAANLEEPEVRPTDLSGFPHAFWEAWEEQFGASFDLTRKYVDFVENLAGETNHAVITTKRSTLLNARLQDETLPVDLLAPLVETLTFKPRPKWREVPPGYDRKDTFPWRLRRQLTVLRKPLVQIDDLDDPTFLVAPGIMREGIAYMLSHYHRGDFPRWQLKPKMDQWGGKSRNAIGREFGQSVTRRLQELGWEAEAEVRVTKLLKQGFDRDYGDVDVLAWHRHSRRVLIIECKDLQFRKAYGEVAEQLADFRGLLRRDGKPDDLLKHLNRVDLISLHPAVVAKYVGCEPLRSIESHLVFKNPVPMQFALKRMAERVTVHIFSGLDKI